MKFLIKITKCKKNEQSSDKNAAIIGRKMYICHAKYYSSIEYVKEISISPYCGEDR